MCNSIHREHEEIPKHGFGWKLFNRDGYGEYISFVEDTHYEKKIGQIIWDETKLSEFERPGDGFCFFLSRNEARKGMKHWFRDGKDKWNKSCIRKIEYWGGICKQTERAFTGDFEEYEVALCKSFRIIEGSKG